MTQIQILDCTLRDGGYINDFAFGQRGISGIIAQLTNAGIDIIETGFLENGDYNPECSVYNTVEQIANFLPTDHKRSMYVAMACYGEYNLDQLTPYNGKSIDGIRVTFHYNEIEDALIYCKEIQDRGYKVFVQPVGTTSYTDEQLISLIHLVNKLHPYAFYLVDTLGLMHKDDVFRFFYLINHNLANNIHMGFHSHNNLQLSYSNCQALASVESDRIISLDSSVYGMGRGAGNLNTELIASYLNEHYASSYEIEPLLEVVDEYIAKIKEKYEWGYSVPYYLAAINGCHPNYASYLSGKNTLNVKSIGIILRMIELEKRSLFDKNLAERKYIEFQSHEINDSATINALKDDFDGKNILLLAPGASLNENIAKILSCAKENGCTIVGVTFVPNFIECNYIFLSNLKRYKTTFNPTHKKINLIHTSNIEVDEKDKIMVNYSSLLNEDDTIRDNSSLMFLNMLAKFSPAKIYIAGMDGYGITNSDYYQDRLVIKHDMEQAIALNAAISKRIEQLKNQLNIEFITPTLYVK
ncbi:aldolase catalytic domain-containing protein [Bacteroides finegoldii]|uniref:aldolase catalytic domain-containing protein n=1 Tax=Bacteroides finegoldii TaxID=338188 RepID=UPI0018A05E3F|nr:aldolase catalytic domain-containing protein [Bacteroides finegoldii]